MKKIKKYLPNNCLPNIPIEEETDIYSIEQLSYLLKYNWEHSSSETIKKAREIAPSWETALAINDNPNENLSNRSLIIWAVYENRQETFNEFSNAETSRLIEKYIDMAKDYYANAILDGRNDIFGEMFNLFEELVPNSTKIVTKLVDLTISIINEEKDENEGTKVFENILELINNEFGSEDTNALIGYISDGQEAAEEVGQLCFSVADDLSNYYDSTLYILNGKVAVKGSIKGLCEDIALATILKKVDETL